MKKIQHNETDARRFFPELALVSSFLITFFILRGSPLAFDLPVDPNQEEILSEITIEDEITNTKINTALADSNSDSDVSDSDVHPDSLCSDDDDSHADCLHGSVSDSLTGCSSDCDRCDDPGLGLTLGN